MTKETRRKMSVARKKYWKEKKALENSDPYTWEDHKKTRIGYAKLEALAKGVPQKRKRKKIKKVIYQTPNWMGTLSAVEGLIRKSIKYLERAANSL